MGKSKTQQQQSTSSTQKNILPWQQQRNVDALMGGVLDYYNSGGRQYYGGDTVAGFSPEQTAGMDSLMNWAQGGGQDYVNQAVAANQFLLDPNQILNPQNIPGYAAAQDATSRMYTDNLLERILPSVRGGATNAGQFGGSAQGIGEALSVGKSNQAMADALTMMDLNAYGQGLSAFQNAQSMAPMMFALGAQPGTIMGTVGDVKQGQQQREIDADVARHMFEQNEPINMLNLLKSITGGFGDYGGTVEGKSDSTSTTTSKSSPLQTALGLGMMAMGVPGLGAPAAAGKGAATAGAGAAGGMGVPGVSSPFSNMFGDILNYTPTPIAGFNTGS